MRRDKYEIIANILKKARDGAKKTRLVYETNLNFTMLRKYIRVLSEKGFIDIHDGIIYSTMKGIAFLEKFEELMGIWNFLETEKAIDEPPVNLDTINDHGLSRRREYVL